MAPEEKLLLVTQIKDKSLVQNGFRKNNKPVAIASRMSRLQCSMGGTKLLNAIKTIFYCFNIFLVYGVFDSKVDAACQSNYFLLTAQQLKRVCYG